MLNCVLILSLRGISKWQNPRPHCRWTSDALPVGEGWCIGQCTVLAQYIDLSSVSGIRNTRLIGNFRSNFHAKICSAILHESCEFLFRHAFSLFASHASLLYSIFSIRILNICASSSTQSPSIRNVSF